MTRTFDELIDDDPAWADVAAAIADPAARTPHVLPPGPAAARCNLLDLQVSTRSTLGAVVLETGGLLFERGRLRVLGSSGGEAVRDVLAWNRSAQGIETVRDLPFLLVADDAFGGFFALNATGVAGAEPGSICYAGPEDLDWDPLGIGYTAFLDWCFTGDLAGFYGDLWHLEDAHDVPTGSALSFYPFLWSSPDARAADVDRRVVPIGELYGVRFG